MRFGSHRPILALVSLLLAACGGAVRSDLFAEDPGFANVGDADAGAAAPGVDAGVVTTDATTSFDSGGGPTDAGRPDVVVVVPDAGSGTIDAGADLQRCGPPANGLSCDRDTRVCCARGTENGRVSYTCALDRDCGGDDVPIECASSSDCGRGKVCCGYLQGSAWYSVECESSCGNTGGFTGVRMCVPGAANACPFGRGCTPSQRLSGYGFCN